MAQLVPPSPRLPRPSGYGSARDLAAFDGELVNSLQRELSEHARRLNGALMADGSEPFNGNMDINGTLHATGAVDLDGNVNIDGTLNVEGATTIDDVLTVTGNIIPGGRVATATTAWTPAVAFGGASVGLTYTHRFGFYTLLGTNMLFFKFDVMLSAKGSSVGTCTIGGLPNAAASVTGSVYMGYDNAFTGIGGHMHGFINGTTIFPCYDNTAGSVQLTDTQCTNTSRWIGGGFIFI